MLTPRRGFLSASGYLALGLAEDPVERAPTGGVRAPDPIGALQDLCKRLYREGSGPNVLVGELRVLGGPYDLGPGVPRVRLGESLGGTRGGLRVVAVNLRTGDVGLGWGDRDERGDERVDQWLHVSLFKRDRHGRLCRAVATPGAYP